MNPRLRYFEGVKTLREAHDRYRLLAKRLHPDNLATGNREWFEEMASEYALVMQQLRARRRPTAVQSEKMPVPSEHSESPPASGPQDELHTALGSLADATGSVVAAWLKVLIRRL